MNNPNTDLPAENEPAPVSTPTVDPRRRLRELLSIPERDRSDEQWDEIIELEIQTAPGNRLSPHEASSSGTGGGGGGRSGGGQAKGASGGGAGQQQKKHRTRTSSNNRRPRQPKAQGGGSSGGAAPAA